MFVTIVKRKMQIDERRWLRGQVLAKIKAEGQIREQDEIKKKREWEEDDDGWRGGRAGSFDNFFTLAQVGGVQLQWHQTKFISASIFIYLSLFFLVGVIWSSLYLIAR